MKEVTVKVPATTANLGPGFDCLGLALGLYNEITFREADTPLQITVTGEGAEKIALDTTNLVYQAAARLFSHTGHPVPNLHIHLHNNIPVGSGLGSSAAAVVGGLVAADIFVNADLSNSEILRLATELEGHPDNATPALIGGLTLSFLDGEQIVVESIPVPDWPVVIVLPDFHLPTAEARAALPKMVSLADAVFNLSRVGLLIRALETGDYNKLGLAMQDRLHQPYRQPLIPGWLDAYRAAQAAGAAAVALSGAGPSLVAFAPHNHDQIGQSCVQAFEWVGVSGRYWVLPIDKQGCSIKGADWFNLRY